MSRRPKPQEPALPSTEPTTVRALLPQGRAIDPHRDFDDLTAVGVAEYHRASDGSLVVEFAGPLTDAEVAAVQRRILSRSAAEEKLREEMAAWLLTAGTAGQDVAAQVERLTRILLSGPIQ